MYHNHIEKDYSYQWITPDKEEKLMEASPEVTPILKNKFLMGMMYIYIYIYFR